MATRDDILQELGLFPVWRRRTIERRPVPEPRDSPVRASVVADEIASRASPVIANEPATVHPSDERTARIARLEWADFAADVDSCTACGLAQTRNRSVPGVGDRHAEWLFVGEAPGADEDAKGEPFVGQAGRLLDSMLAALGIARGNHVYIANVLKCRPPNNRTPEPAEAEACRPYLDRQIALIAPKLIVALGKSAATALLGVDATIASLRGRVHRYRGVPLIVTYHPAYLLRSLPEKAKAWEDLILARRAMRESGGAAETTGAAVNEPPGGRF
jgi:DNA polymerase